MGVWGGPALCELSSPPPVCGVSGTRRGSIREAREEGEEEGEEGAVPGGQR